MTTLARVNSVFSNHNLAANFVGLLLVVAGSVLTVVALNQSGNLTKTSYDTTLRPAVETPVTTVQTAPQTTTITVLANPAQPVSFDTQPNMVKQIQPAPGLNYNTVTANDLQPSMNTVQLTGNGLQNTHVVLQ